ncbi:Glycerate kinase [hydrothermal vent metagenome]|uniref:Glycerate kinase n=1 Tax=hydrothermal vent metagenome TaxID=652676 RepID=A0A3B0XMU2_9ZZZZ
MARFLITGARAPVALELVRNLSCNGHQVCIADSLNYPLAKNSRHVKKYRLIAEPGTQLKKFQQDLIKYIKEEEIDYLLPTCEEVFYVSFLKSELSKYCNVICDSFDLLSTLHSKYTIMELALDCGISLPVTEKVNASGLKSYKDKIKNKVIKKEFSRFGIDVLLISDRKLFNQYIKYRSGNFVVQEKIKGIEYSTYSIAYNGVVMAHSCYQSLYRVTNSAGYYFKAVKHVKIQKFVSLFVEKHGYTGQIGFDIIDNGDDIYLIECNPRATSGVHLLKNEDLAACLLGNAQQSSIMPGKPVMIAMAMNLIALPRAVSEFKLVQWYRDYCLAEDIMASNGDRSYILYSLVSLLELIKKSILKKTSLRTASTQDIEWDGRPL